MKQNEILYLVISVFVVTVFWIGLSIWHAHVNSTISDTQNIQVQPISPHFNRKIIEKLKTRKVVDPLLSPIPASISATVQPTVSPKPSTTPVATPAPTSGSSKP